MDRMWTRCNAGQSNRLMTRHVRDAAEFAIAGVMSVIACIAATAQGMHACAGNANWLTSTLAPLKAPAIRMKSKMREGMLNSKFLGSR